MFLLNGDFFNTNYNKCICYHILDVLKIWEWEMCYSIFALKSFVYEKNRVGLSRLYIDMCSVALKCRWLLGGLGTCTPTFCHWSHSRAYQTHILIQNSIDTAFFLQYWNVKSFYCIANAYSYSNIQAIQLLSLCGGNAWRAIFSDPHSNSVTIFRTLDPDIVDIFHGTCFCLPKILFSQFAHTEKL